MCVCNNLFGCIASHSLSMFVYFTLAWFYATWHGLAVFCGVHLGGSMSHLRVCLCLYILHLRGTKSHDMLSVCFMTYTYMVLRHMA